MSARLSTSRRLSDSSRLKRRENLPPNIGQGGYGARPVERIRRARRVAGSPRPRLSAEIDRRKHWANSRRRDERDSRQRDFPERAGAPKIRGREKPSQVESSGFRATLGRRLKSSVLPSKTGTQYECEADLGSAIAVNLRRERRRHARAVFAPRLPETCGSSRRPRNSLARPKPEAKDPQLR